MVFGHDSMARFSHSQRRGQRFNSVLRAKASRLKGGQLISVSLKQTGEALIPGRRITVLSSEHSNFQGATIREMAGTKTLNKAAFTEELGSMRKRVAGSTAPAPSARPPRLYHAAYIIYSL
jgi:hypothetical protein